MALVYQTIIIVFCIGYYFFDQQKRKQPFYDVSTKIHKKYHPSIQHRFKYNGSYPITTGRNMSIIKPFVLESSNGRIAVDGINQLEVVIPDSRRFKKKYVKDIMESSNSSMAEEITYQWTKPASGFYLNEEFGRLGVTYHLWIDERIEMDDEQNFDKTELAELFTSNNAINLLSQTLLRQNKKIEPTERNGIYTTVIPYMFDCSSDDVDIKCRFFNRNNKYDIQSMLALQDWENILRITLSQLINDGYVGGKVTVLPSDKSFEILLNLGLALEPKVLEEEYAKQRTMKLRETILNEI